MSSGIGRMTDEQMRDFVIGVLDGRIFVSSFHMRPSDQTDRIVGMVFMPLCLGALSYTRAWKRSKVNEIGAFWEYLDAAGPRSVNGYPIFLSCKIIHIKDVKRARAVIEREQSRRRSIEV